MRWVVLLALLQGACDEPCAGLNLQQRAYVTETGEGDLELRMSYYRADGPLEFDREQCCYIEHQVVAIAGDDMVPLTAPAQDGQACRVSPSQQFYTARVPDDGRTWTVIATGVPGEPEPVETLMGMPGDFVVVHDGESFQRSEELVLQWASDPPPAGVALRVLHPDGPTLVPMFDWEIFDDRLGARLPAGTLNYNITDGSSTDLRFDVTLGLLNGSRERSLTLRSEP